MIAYSLFGDEHRNTAPHYFLNLIASIEEAIQTAHDFDQFRFIIDEVETPSLDIPHGDARVVRIKEVYRYGWWGSDYNA